MVVKSLIEFSWLILLLMCSSLVDIKASEYTNEQFLEEMMLPDMNILRNIPKSNKVVSRLFAKAPEMFKSLYIIRKIFQVLKNLQLK